MNHNTKRLLGKSRQSVITTVNDDTRTMRHEIHIRTKVGKVSTIGTKLDTAQLRRAHKKQMWNSSKA